MSASTKSAPVGASENAVMDDHTKKILDVKTLMREREKSRKNNDFTKSDNIRDKLLAEFNVEIFDQKNGPSGWKFKDGASKKLAAGLTLPPEITASLKRDRSENTKSNNDRSENPKSAEKKQKTEEQPKKKGNPPPQISPHICSPILSPHSWQGSRANRRSETQQAGDEHSDAHGGRCDQQAGRSDRRNGHRLGQGRGGERQAH